MDGFNEQWRDSPQSLQAARRCDQLQGLYGPTVKPAVDAPTASFDAGTNILVIRSSHYIPGDAHCCVSAMDVVTFRWDQTRFVQSELQTELSKYGKTAGKVLPK